MKVNKEEVKLCKVEWNRIVWYSGFFRSQYVRVYVNKHDSLSVKVFIKIGQLNNLHMSKNDASNGCWLFTLDPGQTVIKRLYPIDPFQMVSYKGMSKKFFIVNPNNPYEYSLKELMTPELLPKEGLTKIATSRG